MNTIKMMDFLHGYVTWHILDDRLIPLAPLGLVGLYMELTKSLTFSRVFPKGCHG